MVKLGGPPGDPRTRAHVEFCRRAGFNAVWVYSHDAGRWTPQGAADGPYLDPAFLELARWCRAHGMRLFVSVNPVADSRGRFVFTEARLAHRIVLFLRLLHREAGVEDFVLSFDDQPTILEELRDVLAFGRSAAAAHVDLLRRVRRELRGRGRLWFCPSAYCDRHIGDGHGPYSRVLLRELPRVSRRVGLVWTGPEVISPAIRLEDVQRVWSWFGQRPILLYDNFPVNEDVERDALALVLAPLRERDPRLAGAVAAYLACPMRELGASRLALLTVADFLSEPWSYDADQSWERAIARLAGSDGAAREALRTQALEWGGWVGTRNYRGAPRDNLAQALAALDDPGRLAQWSWVVRRYPSRMRALEGLADEAFRDELLERMRLRLAVARALPLLQEYRARARANRQDLAEILRDLVALRDALPDPSDSRERFARFLALAGLRMPEPRAAARD